MYMVVRELKSIDIIILRANNIRLLLFLTRRKLRKYRDKIQKQHFKKKTWLRIETRNRVFAAKMIFLRCLRFISRSSELKYEI